jgi:hypothetical protein
MWPRERSLREPFRPLSRPFDEIEEERVMNAAFILVALASSIGDPPPLPPVLQLRLSLLVTTLQDINGVDDDIRTLVATARRSPQLAKQCEAMINELATQRRDLLCLSWKLGCGLMADMFLQFKLSVRNYFQIR